MTFINSTWQKQLEERVLPSTFEKLRNFEASQRSQYEVYPPAKQVWRAFDRTPFEKVKVVILGQDPYHGPGQANGLSFSVNPGIKIPPSLVNMYKELEDDLGIPRSQNGDLTSWADQGVLMLNTVLTVRAGEANSHRNQGWEEVTDAAIASLAEKEEPIIFILWGKASQAKSKLIDQSKDIIIQSAHPSPLSAYRGFFGSKPFSQVNEQLIKLGMEPINWEIKEEGL